MKQNIGSNREFMWTQRYNNLGLGLTARCGIFTWICYFWLSTGFYR